MLIYDITEPELDGSPVKAESSSNFERNYSGQRGSRSITISVKEKSLNPFLEDVDRAHDTVMDGPACDVSTQTELAGNKKDNCKLM